MKKEVKKEVKKVPNISGRTFTAALKPAWTYDKITDFINGVDGAATVWVATHDKDYNDKGEIVESHTHVLISYKTPRKITTVANTIGVAPNFIVLVKNKTAVLKYLTHYGSPDKYQYNDSIIITNDVVPYSTSIMKNSLSNSDIIDYIKTGRTLDIVDLVEPNKLRALQSLVHFDNSNALLNEIKALRSDFIVVRRAMDNINEIISPFINGLNAGVLELVGAMRYIGDEIAATKSTISRKAIKANPTYKPPL